VPPSSLAQYAAEHNLPSYRNLLVPRITGFVSCVKMLGTHIDAIYDFTLCYTSRFASSVHPPHAAPTVVC
jgi:hypothetical protein